MNKPAAAALVAVLALSAAGSARADTPACINFASVIAQAHASHDVVVDLTADQLQNFTVNYNRAPPSTFDHFDEVSVIVSPAGLTVLIGSAGCLINFVRATPADVSALISAPTDGGV